MTTLLIVLALGNAAVGGTYFAFTVMVIPALARLDAAPATAAMQSINRVAERGQFVVVFAATALLAVAAAVVAVVTDAGPWALAAAVFAIVGTAITVAGNVPLNRRLDREGAAHWPEYRRPWTRLNTLRGVAHLAAVVFGSLALLP